MHFAYVSAFAKITSFASIRILTQWGRHKIDIILQTSSSKFFVWKLVYFYTNVTEICFWESRWQWFKYPQTGNKPLSDPMVTLMYIWVTQPSRVKTLWPCDTMWFRQQAITWTNAGLSLMTVFEIRSETCRTEAQFCQNLYVIKKESLSDQPKLYRSGSAVQHLFWSNL